MGRGRSERRRKFLSGACAIAVLGAWYLLLAPARIGGPLTPVVVRGDSMLPTYEPDDLVVAYRARRYEVGDVIVFRPHPGGAVVIHRVVEMTPAGIVTQGDNTVAMDPWELAPGDVLGRARLRIPRVGWLLDPSAHPLVVAAVAGALAAAVAAIVADERRGARTGSAALVLLALAVAGSVVPVTRAAAAGFTVTSDGIATFTVPAADSTSYVVNPGGGGGGPPGGGGGPPGGKK